MALYKHEDGTYTISSHSVWMPGCYEDAKTARYAFRFSDSILTSIMKEANERAGGCGGTITYLDLKQAKKRMLDKFTLREKTHG